MLTLELLLNAIVAGVLLGGFLAAASLGVSIVFGLLDIVNIAHPVFVVLGSYAVYALNSNLGIDPVLAGVLVAPLFFALGVAIYRVYYVFFERTGAESLRGIVSETRFGKSRIMSMWLFRMIWIGVTANSPG